MVQNGGGEALVLWQLEGLRGGQALVYDQLPESESVKAAAGRRRSRADLTNLIIAYWLRMSRIILSRLDAAGWRGWIESSIGERPQKNPHP